VRIAIVAVATLLVGTAAFYVGALVGFVEGQAVYFGRQAPFEASWITATLTALREDRSSEAVALLEGRLDSQLLTHGVHLLAGPPRFERPGLDPVLGYNLLEHVAEYRSQNPPVSENPGVASTLKGLVGCLQRAPFGSPKPEVQNYLRACYRRVWSRAAQQGTAADGHSRELSVAW